MGWRERWREKEEGRVERERQGKGGERFKDVILMSSNLEEGVMSQGMWAASSSWKMQGKGFFPQAPRKKTAQLTHFKFLTSLTVR